MTKKESTFLSMTITLLVVTGFAALALGGVYNLTKERIEEAKREKLIAQYMGTADIMEFVSMLNEDMMCGGISEQEIRAEAMMTFQDYAVPADLMDELLERCFPSLKKDKKKKSKKKKKGLFI